MNNQIIELEITKYDYSGRGIARYNEMVVFVSNALVGEKVLAQITNRQKSFIEAVAINISNNSADREKPVCPHYHECGGCDLQHMSYKAQLDFKRELVQNTLTHVGHIDVNVNEIIALDEWHYRNKVEFKFSATGKMGFYKKQTHDVFDIRECRLVNPLSLEIAKFIQEECIKNRIPFFNLATKKGSLKELVIRNSRERFMVVFVTHTNTLDKLDIIAQKVKEKFSCVSSIIHNVNKNILGQSIGQNSYTIIGDSFLYTEILGNKFKISPESFFQVNTNTTIKLYEEAFRLANFNKDDIIIDAYSGIGSIGICLAKKVKMVYGIEIVGAAVNNANENKQLNEIDNIEFFLGSCERKINEVVAKENITGIIFDPPRKGCELSFLETVIEARIPKIVYISCNVRTLARDLNILVNNNYHVVEVTPVDMFRCTTHVETVCLLSRNPI